MKDIAPITVKHFEQSISVVRPSVPMESLVAMNKWNDLYGSKLSLNNESKSDVGSGPDGRGGRSGPGGRGARGGRGGRGGSRGGGRGGRGDPRDRGSNVVNSPGVMSSPDEESRPKAAKDSNGFMNSCRDLLKKLKD